ncbi:hypothetical protein C4577_03530 [Candidatus Parcubacteria bacterium]|nr:MAG: hypothetical protein C4577_03530 [Candidatus Parcubacteria bacterium]
MKKYWRVLLLALFTPFLLAFSGENEVSSFSGDNNKQPKVENQFVKVDQPISGPPAPRVDVPVNNAVRLSIPFDAVSVVQQDAIEVEQKDPFSLPFIRWIWVQSGDINDFQALSDTLQKISRSEVPIQPVIRGIVARIDLRWFAASKEDLQDWINLWENFQFDPWFSTNITQNTLALLSEDYKQNKIVQVWKNRRVWDKDKQIWVNTGEKVIADVKIASLKDVLVVRSNADHLKKSGIEMLQFGTKTLAPVVDSRYFTGRVLSTIKGKINGKDSVFSTIWGGLYYEFSGIRKATTKGIKNDFDQLLFDLGVGSKEEDYEQLFERTRGGLEAAGMFHSNVTGKPRRIIWFPIEKMRLTQGIPAIFITEDIKDEDVDTDAHPILNLVKFKPDAYEVIFVKLNGQQGYAIFNGKKELLDEATQDVVSDHKIPVPNTTRLQSAISCIRCHGSDDGWKPFSNDVKTLLSRKNNNNLLDVFGDTSKSELNKPIFDTLLNIAGKYEGDPTVLMMDLRRAYAKGVLRATGPWKNDNGQLNTVKLSSERIAAVYAEDRYNLIDAELALRYLGYPQAPKGKEVEVLNKVLPPVKLNIGGIVPEDARIGALKRGIKITPRDWAFVYSFALTRAMETASQMKDKK